MRKPHKRLLAWQRAMDLVVKIYLITEKFPLKETYGLIGQLRRSLLTVHCLLHEIRSNRR